MAGRVTQQPLEISGSGQTVKALVTQVPIEISGQPPTVQGLVTQFVIEISSEYGRLYIDQGVRLNNTNTFPAGGSVTFPGLPVDQAATFVNTNSFPSPGDVRVYIPIDQAATFVNTNSFPAGGSLLPTIVQAATYTNPNVFFAGGDIHVLTPIPVTQAATFDNTNQFFAVGQLSFGSRPLLPPQGGAVGLLLPYPPPHPLNEWDALLAAQAALFQSIMYPSREGVQSLNGLGEDLAQAQAPFSSSDRERGIPLIQSTRVPGPDNLYATSRMYFEQGSIVTPAPGGDVEVLQFKVPTGYWGKILGVYLHYTGTGFVPGSGDIIWRIQIGNRYLKGFGNCTVNLGSAANTAPLSEWENLRTQRLVRVWVNVPNISGAIQVGASRILVGVAGVFYSVEERIERG